MKYPKYQWIGRKCEYQYKGLAYQGISYMYFSVIAL